jgi:hypothetical protein
VEVLDRYLLAVGSWLPRDHRADTVAELRDDLLSEIVEREHQAGRPLDEASVCAILAGRGHPMWVAEGYLPGRHLIGPVVLSLYSRTLKTALSFVWAAFAVPGVGQFAGLLRVDAHRGTIRTGGVTRVGSLERI